MWSPLRRAAPEGQTSAADAENHFADCGTVRLALRPLRAGSKTEVVPFPFVFADRSSRLFISSVLTFSLPERRASPWLDSRGGGCRYVG